MPPPRKLLQEIIHFIILATSFEPLSQETVVSSNGTVFPCFKQLCVSIAVS
eukprot:c20518_g3_i1 orf=1-150(-)